MSQKPKSPKNRSKSPGKESVKDSRPHSNLEGGDFIKHVLKKSGKNNGQLNLDELDEVILKEKLALLTKELNDYKEKCSKYKKDNQWYQQEIDFALRDNAEYISYLESKKDEKLIAIQKLADGNKKDQEMFLEKKEKYRVEFEMKIADLQDSIAELEVKLNGKEDEFLQLSDTMLKRSKHYDDIQKIRDQIKQSELANQEFISKLEKSLLDARIKLQSEADQKIKVMEAAAEEKAANYLAKHTDTIIAENNELELKLSRITRTTQSLILRRDQLHDVINELSRETKVRDDLVEIRAEQIGKAVKKEMKRREEKAAKEAKWRRAAVEGTMEAEGIIDGMPEDWFDVSDDD